MGHGGLTSSEVSMLAVCRDPVVTGRGMVTVIGRWNFRLRGSTVTTGEAAPAWVPSSEAGTGNTLRPTLISLVRARAGK